MQVLLDQFLKAIGWALIHSIWLGCIAALVAALIIVLLKKQAPALRYRLLTGVLALFTVTVVLAFFQQWNHYNRFPGNITAPATPEQVAVIATRPSVYNMVSNSPALLAVITFIESNLIFIFCAWFILFVCRSVSLTKGLSHLHRLRRTQSTAISAAWQARSNVLARRAGINNTHSCRRISQSGRAANDGLARTNHTLTSWPAAPVKPFPGRYDLITRTCPH